MPDQQPSKRPPPGEATKSDELNQPGGGNGSLYAADLLATALFAVEGSTAAAAANLDAFGIVVVGMVTALVGGIVRDVLLGSLPPDALRGKAHLLTALGGGLCVVALNVTGTDVPMTPLWILDAAGLALFAATGAQKALRHGINGVGVVVLATVTGTGGGMLRDLLLNKTPAVLTQDIYATAAAAAGLLFWLCRRAGLSWQTSLAISTLGAFTLRFGSVVFSWQLPHFAPA